MDLLELHMSPRERGYLEGHAIIAGKIAQKGFESYAEYVTACKMQGIIYYDEECYNEYFKEQEGIEHKHDAIMDEYLSAELPPPAE